MSEAATQVVPAIPPRRLTLKEQALWSFQLLVTDNGVTNEAIAFDVPGRLDADILRDQIDTLVRRHSALRTLYPEVRGEPIALVLPPDRAAVALAMVDEPDGPVADVLGDFANGPFDPRSQAPLRVGLFRYPDGDVCCLVFNHLAYDMWTAGVLFAELRTGYDDATTGRPIGALDGQVAAWSEPLPSAEDLAYWREVLGGADIEGQRLDLGRPESRNTAFVGAARSHDFSAAACEALATLAKRYRVTDNIILMAAYYLLLARHGGGTDRVVGVRTDAREETARGAVGYHVNTLPMRLTVELDGGVGALIDATKRVFLGGLDHRSASYEALLPDLGDAGSGWRTGLFRHVYNYRPIRLSEQATIGGLRVRFLDVEVRHSRYDLEFILESGLGLSRVRTVFSTEMFDERDIAALQERYDALLVGLAAATETTPLREVVWWSAADEAAVRAANDTEGPVGPSIAALFAAKVHATPDATAVVDTDRKWSYGRLATTAERIRAWIVAKGVAPGDVVAVRMSRGAPLAAAVLAVWAAGGAYLPLHPDHPAERVGFQIRDCGATLVLTDSDLPEGADPGVPVVDVRAPEPEAVADSAILLASLTAVGPATNAYVIYTSGSTGNPKGIPITHHSLGNHVAHFAADVDMAAEDAVLWLNTIAFDISTLELCLALSVGGRLVVASDEARADAREVLRLIAEHDVLVAQATPTVWSAVLAAAPAEAGVLRGREIIVGGEPLSRALAATLAATGCRLSNAYGPTETTLWSTTAVVDHPVTGQPGVGKPIRNVTVMVTDSAGYPLPPGITGELRIGGVGVAEGYVNRPELTECAFGGSERGDRWYRTGDRGRWRYDGTLELDGRMDRQVKVRGNRLELGEVEAVLAGHPGVVLAAATLRDELGEHDRLIAFVQPADPDADPTALADDVWRYCRPRLPRYALPSRIVPARIPVNANGKVDLPALATLPLGEHDPGRREGDVDAGPAPDHDWLVTLWQDILDDPGIGPEANFFLCGGHSLLAVRLLRRIGDTTGSKLTLIDLLEAPSPVEMAGLLASKSKGRAR